MEYGTAKRVGVTAIAGTIFIALITVNAEYIAKRIGADAWGYNAFIWIGAMMGGPITVSLPLLGIAILAVGAAINAWSDYIWRKWRGRWQQSEHLSFRPPDRKLIAMTLLIFFGTGFALSVLWLAGERFLVNKATAVTPLAGVKSPIEVTVETVKIPAPYYTKADVERVLEATFEISDLLQRNAIPARDAAEAFLNEWQNLLQIGGEPVFRQRLKEVRTLMESVNNGGWAISNKYQHYNAEIGPVLAGMAFAEKFFAASNNFDMAGENLHPVITQKTLTFLLPMRDAYEQGVGGLRQWMSDTSSRARETTDRFRRIAQKAD